MNWGVEGELREVNWGEEGELEKRSELGGRG